VIHQEEIAANISAFNNAQRLAGKFQVVATAKPGGDLAPLQRAIDEELRKLAAEGPTAREMEQAMNAMEASFLNSVQTVIGKADQLNSYYYETGDPDGFQRDLDRLKAVTPADVRRVVGHYLLGPRAIVGVVPEGQLDKGAVRREVTP
jgi:predicted Zn-dependent peptidase